MIRTAAHRACRTWAAACLRPPRRLQTTTAHPAPVAPILAKAMTTSTKPIKEEMLNWRFPVNDRMEGMVSQVESGYGRQTTILTLNVVKPITHDLAKEALVHLYDKVESLRQCFRPRGGQLWIADMPHRKLDFQIVSGSDLEEQHILLRDSPFDLQDGPLWKVRLMTCPEDAPCHIPEVKTTFPHQYHLLLSLHHAANDGTVVMMLTQLLIDILDRLLQGIPVNAEQVGELRDDVEAREEEAKIRAALQNNPERLVAALRQHVRGKHLPLLMEVFGLPKVTNPTTENLPAALLDKQLMEKFANKCRSLGATINAGFTALINMSLVEVVREAGLERDVYNISSGHSVDSRRIMRNCQNLPLGYHSIPMTQSTATPRDVKEHFWQYVKHLDIELREKLKRNYMCEERVLEVMMRPEGYTHEAQYARRQLPYCDYVFSNLYSPRTSYEGIGKCVQITSARNFMSVHNERYAVGVGLFSFRGQARLQLAFSTAAVSKEVAQRCLEKNVAVFHDVSRELD